jgi:hypothetical protein
MLRDCFNRPNHVYGKFDLKKGWLTFRTTDAAIVQRLERDHARGVSSKCIYSALSRTKNLSALWKLSSWCASSVRSGGR